MGAKRHEQPLDSKPRKGTRTAPKFTHLPVQRGAYYLLLLSRYYLLRCVTDLPTCQSAKKLKEEWIAKQKIKNAYRAQKRRGALSLGPSESSAQILPAAAAENLAPVDSRPDATSEPDEDDGDNASDKSNSPELSPTVENKAFIPPSRTIHSSRQQRTHQSTNSSYSAVKAVSHSSDRPIHPARLKRKAKQEAAAAASSQSQDVDKATRAKELIREAYSASSLHTFKSDPLRKRGHQENSSRGRDRGDGRGSGRGTTGKGQPDMRKRMGALLAQIEAQK